MKEKFRLNGLVLAVSACLMAGCGGGGGGGSSSADTPAGPAETPASVNVSLPVQVIDGYLADIDVCIVKENDPSLGCDESFGTAKTNAEGRAVFTGKEEQFTSLADRGYVRFKAVAKKGGRNIIRGQETDLDNDAMLLATRFLSHGDIENMKDGNNSDAGSTITPFTTLAEKYLSTGSSAPDEASYSEALGKIAELLGLDVETITSDYNAADAQSDKADRALAAGELIVSSNLLPNNAAAFSSPLGSEQKDVNLEAQMSSVSSKVDKVIDEAGSAGSLADAIMNRKDTLRNSFVSLSSGLAEAWRCGTTDANEVWCWGINTWKNLGNPEFSEKVAATGKYSPEGAEERFENLAGNYTAEPVHVLMKNPDRKAESDPEYIPLKGVAKVASGNIFACAVTVDREVWCWGGNYQGQLGYGSANYSKENEAIPYAVRVVAGEQKSESGYLENVVDLSAGHNNICALTGDGDVYCWGDNTGIELGSAAENMRVHPIEQYTSYDGLDLNPYLWVVPEPVKVPAPEGTKFVSMTKGGYWTHCALTDPEENEYNLWCWGDDVRGMVSGGSPETAVAYAYVIDNKWSDRQHHENQNYNREESWNWRYWDKGSGDWWPMFGQPVTNVKQYLVSEKKHVYDGQHAGYFWSQQPEALEMKRISSADITEYDSVLIFSSLSDGSSSLHGIYTDNHVFAFDYDWFSPYPWTDPANTWSLFDKLPDDGDKISRVVTSSENQLDFILTEKGKVYEFGSGGYSMLGDGGENRYAWQYENPTFKDDRYQVKDVAIGKRSVCALATDSESKNPDVPGLWCWGSSAFGQLGFDNGQDSEISWSDISAAWNGSANSYLDDAGRIQDTPKAVDFGL